MVLQVFKRRYSNKTSDLAVKLAASELSYTQARQWEGSEKSSLCRWVSQKALGRPEMAGKVLELDGLWARNRRGPVELKVIRDDLGIVLGQFGTWKEVIDRAWQAWAEAPVHLVSDGDRAIAHGLKMVYGRLAPHQLCHFHLLQNYRRNIGWEGCEEAEKLLSSRSRQEGVEYAKGIVASTRGRGAYWCRKALNLGLRHLDTG